MASMQLCTLCNYARYAMPAMQCPLYALYAMPSISMSVYIYMNKLIVVGRQVYHESIEGKCIMRVSNIPEHATHGSYIAILTSEYLSYSDLCRMSRGVHSQVASASPVFHDSIYVYVYIYIYFFSV